jgi:hypothetical protein
MKSRPLDREFNYKANKTRIIYSAYIGLELRIFKVSHELVAEQNDGSIDVYSYRFNYSLRPILLFANMDVSTTKRYLDISVLAKNIMGRRE